MLGDVGIATDGAEVPNEVRVPRARTPLRIVNGATAGGEDERLWGMNGNGKMSVDSKSKPRCRKLR
jgi:hypothetical protein